jgi:Ulp1 family protease
MYYDSFGRDNKSITGSLTKFLHQWQEHIGTTISNWKIKRAYSPPQSNTFDCGPWILQTAKCISLQEPLIHEPQFNQDMMQSIRATQKSEL